MLDSDYGGVPCHSATSGKGLAEQSSSSPGFDIGRVSDACPGPDYSLLLPPRESANKQNFIPEEHTASISNILPPSVEARDKRSSFEACAWEVETLDFIPPSCILGD